MQSMELHLLLSGNGKRPPPPDPLIFGHFFVAGAVFMRYNCFVVGFLMQSSARFDPSRGPAIPRVRYWWPRLRDVDVVQAIATSFEFSEV